MQIIKFRFTATTHLLMHSERGVNPLDEKVQEFKKLTSKRKKTDEDLREIAWAEYQLAIYHDDELGPFIPAMNIDRCIQDGAKKNRLGKVFASSARCVADRIPLIYEGPRDVKKLYDENFRLVRSVGVAQSRIIRCRPQFRNWAVEFDFAYDENEIDESSVILAAETAGRIVGILDYRPRYGRFEVEVL